MNLREVVSRLTDEQLEQLEDAIADERRERQEKALGIVRAQHAVKTVLRAR